jgi:hypothetical protein
MIAICSIYGFEVCRSGDYNESLFSRFSYIHLNPVFQSVACAVLNTRKLFATGNLRLYRICAI